MRLLLDTPALLWWDEGRGLSNEAFLAIQHADQVFVSAVAGLEMAVKASSRGRSLPRATSVVIRESGFTELPVFVHHTELVAELPRHHRDPFDRLMIAQAMIEKLTIVTRDRMFARYEVKTIAA